jgi:hypothetical protein
MNLPRIVIVTAAALTDINRICHAMGLGTGYIGRKLCAEDPQADHTTSATHYLVNDMSAQVDDDPIWQGMANDADLPPIAGVWGEEGVISAQDAQAALTFGNMQVYTAAGMDLDSNPSAAIEWRNGILTGRGLQFVPDEPI